MSAVILEKTLKAFEDAVHADQGATFRRWLQKTLPAISDAYSADSFPFRSHLGASIIGGPCVRKVWYSFRWSWITKHSGRLLRLFNRGHTEEARFIALLLSIGCTVYQQDEHGNQFRIKHAQGHFGGSGDGVALGLPDLPVGEPVLLEFKTSADSPFKKVLKEGVKRAKPEHYIQMQVYMGKMRLKYAAYFVVNKNNDELYGELIAFDDAAYNHTLEKAVMLVDMRTPPAKLNESPSFYMCKWCEYMDLCHKGAEPLETCRSCQHSMTSDNGEWMCIEPSRVYITAPLTKHNQLEGCKLYKRLF